MPGRTFLSLFHPTEPKTAPGTFTNELLNPFSSQARKMVPGSPQETISDLSQLSKLPGQGKAAKGEFVWKVIDFHSSYKTDNKKGDISSGEKKIHDQYGLFFFLYVGKYMIMFETIYV